MNPDAGPARARRTKGVRLEPPKQREWDPDSPHDANTDDDRTNAWHHLPLALVALPPLLSIIHGRAENWSDAILLLLVAFYLYQLVKVPWDLYYAAHTRTVLPNELAPNSPEPDPVRARSAAALRRNELGSLVATALVPVAGAYLLHYVRGLLSDPDRYINPTLINMFAIATTVKPVLHLVQLLKNQSLYHQEVVHYPSSEVYALRQRVDKLEADLVQLSRAFATKADVRALRDGVDVPLSALSHQVKRFSRKEEYLRLTSEERFNVLASRIDDVVEQNRERDAALDELDRDRKRRNDVDFAQFVGRMLGHVFALPAYGGGGSSSSSLTSSSKGKRKGGGGGQTELGWYERGLTWYIFWPVNLPKKAVGWAAEKAGATVKGIEQGYVEEKELKTSTGGRAGGGGGSRRSASSSTTTKRNHALKA
ncbi:hypothetical protein JCM11491_004531 [Sporobolomyces phaffii]